ncbi:MAG: HPr family phosphocarrier protein [Candidatus Electryonea clarkiae]|nr:HPr family phosphocarrier protein [Candidatus Electryonea clarkiae]MDP8285240.1 HPr family phosphocarrier protein [Candidatus Electryonea clarkiae]
MQQSFVILLNKLGLHARPASHLVKIAAKYKDTTVEIAHRGEVVNAKSILGVMMLAAGQGTELELRVEGPQEEECIKDIVQLINDKFYED